MCYQSGNLLLQQLPDEELRHLLPYLQLVTLEKDQVVFQQDERVSFFYFPLTAVVSCTITLGDGYQTDLALMDSAGMFPLSIMVDTHSLLGVKVFLPGLAYRLPVDVLRQEFGRGQGFSKLVMRVVRNMLAQVCLSFACYRRHSTAQILAKLLLMALEHRPDGELPITHEQLADVVGVRREAVTLALKQLERKGVLQCQRGKIQVLDRSTLQRQACSCFQVQHNLGMFQRLLV